MYYFSSNHVSDVGSQRGISRGATASGRHHAPTSSAACPDIPAFDAEAFGADSGASEEGLTPASQCPPQLVPRRTNKK